jgi:phenylacetate-CoA ligase
LTRRWTTALVANGVRRDDRVLLALDAPDCRAALLELGAPIIEAPPGHAARASELMRSAATILMCTPTDALHLAEAATAHGLDLVESGVRMVVVSGEVGGHVPSTRQRIEERFGARCVDVYALHELGLVGWECALGPTGIHLDDDFTVDVDGAELLLNGQRTGDVVEIDDARCACGRATVRVLGRVDERLTVRGVELLPSTLENIVRRHPAVTEYRIVEYQVGGRCELAVEIEPDQAVASEGDRARVAAEVAEDLRRSLGLRLPCEAIPPGSLPRDDSRPRRVVRAAGR